MLGVGISGRWLISGLISSGIEGVPALAEGKMPSIRPKLMATQ